MIMGSAISVNLKIQPMDLTTLLKMNSQGSYYASEDDLAVPFVPNYIYIYSKVDSNVVHFIHESINYLNLTSAPGKNSLAYNKPTYILMLLHWLSFQLHAVDKCRTSSFTRFVSSGCWRLRFTTTSCLL